MLKRPGVCFDESWTQLIGAVRQPMTTKPGQPKRYDYEYKRDGPLIVFLKRARALVKGQSHRQLNRGELRGLHVRSRDVHFPKAERIRDVLDHRSTHSRSVPSTRLCRLTRRATSCFGLSSTMSPARQLTQYGPGSLSEQIRLCYQSAAEASWLPPSCW